MTDAGTKTTAGNTSAWEKVRSGSSLPVGRDAIGNELRHSKAVKTDSCYMVQKTRTLYTLNRVCGDLSFTAYNTSGYTARVQIVDYDTKIVLWSANLASSTSLTVIAVDLSDSVRVEFIAELIDAPLASGHYYDAVYICDPIVDTCNGNKPKAAHKSFLDAADIGVDTTLGNTSTWYKVRNTYELPVGQGGTGGAISHAEAVKTEYLFMRQDTGKAFTLDGLYDSLSFTAYNQSGYTARVKITDYVTGITLWSATLAAGESMYVPCVDIAGSLRLELVAHLTDAPLRAGHYYDAVYLCDPVLDMVDGGTIIGGDNGPIGSGNTGDSNDNRDGVGDSGDDDSGNNECVDVIITDSFIDPAFLSEVRRIIGKPTEDILLSDVDGIGTLFLFNKGIASLSGIGHFASLTYLECSNNNLSVIDVSVNTRLKTLNCNNNQLTSLDISKNTMLTELRCNRNHITGFDVSHNASLMILDCSMNRLQSLDVAGNTLLENLDCHNNHIGVIDVSNNAALKALDCSGNQLNSIDVSRNMLLENLNCSNNRISELDVSNNVFLKKLECSANHLQTLNIHNNTLLERLVCRENMLTAIDVSPHESLQHLDLFRNQLTEIDISTNLDLVSFNIGMNYITAPIDVSRHKKLEGLYLFNNNIGKVDVSLNPLLRDLSVYDCNLTELDVTNNPLLYFLGCGNNQLTELDLSNNPMLDYLVCSNNPIGRLDLSNNPVLRVFHCYRNGLTELDLSQNTKLSWVFVEHNRLTTLDVSTATALERLNCNDNAFASESAVMLPPGVEWGGYVIFGTQNP